MILIFDQPIDKFDSYNAATRRQAPLPGSKPACGRFPRLAAFYLPPLSIEQSKISMKIPPTVFGERYFASNLKNLLDAVIMEKNSLFPKLLYLLRSCKPVA